MWSVGEQIAGRSFHVAIDRVCPIVVDAATVTPVSATVALGDRVAWRFAVANALQSFGVEPRQLPLTPTYIWELVQAGQRKAAE